MTTHYDIGSLVVHHDDHGGETIGVVSRRIDSDSPGHVLIVVDDGIVGIQASVSDVADPDEDAAGFAELAYRLNTLSSKVIEQKLLVQGPDS